jgi:hypothetical protein
MTEPIMSFIDDLRMPPNTFLDPNYFHDMYQAHYEKITPIVNEFVAPPANKYIENKMVREQLHMLMANVLTFEEAEQTFATQVALFMGEYGMFKMNKGRTPVTPSESVRAPLMALIPKLPAEHNQFRWTEFKQQFLQTGLCGFPDDATQVATFMNTTVRQTAAYLESIALMESFEKALDTVRAGIVKHFRLTRCLLTLYSKDDTYIEKIKATPTTPSDLLIDKLSEKLPNDFEESALYIDELINTGRVLYTKTDAPSSEVDSNQYFSREAYAKVLSRYEKNKIETTNAIYLAILNKLSNELAIVPSLNANIETVNGGGQSLLDMYFVQPVDPITLQKHLDGLNVNILANLFMLAGCLFFVVITLINRDSEYKLRLARQQTNAKKAQSFIKTERAKRIYALKSQLSTLTPVHVTTKELIEDYVKQIDATLLETPTVKIESSLNEDALKYWAKPVVTNSFLKLIFAGELFSRLSVLGLYITSITPAIAGALANENINEIKGLGNMTAIVSETNELLGDKPTSSLLQPAYLNPAFRNNIWNELSAVLLQYKSQPVLGDIIRFVLGVSKNTIAYITNATITEPSQIFYIKAPINATLCAATNITQTAIQFNNDLGVILKNLEDPKGPQSYFLVFQDVMRMLPSLLISSGGAIKSFYEQSLIEWSNKKGSTAFQLTLANAGGFPLFLRNLFKPAIAPFISGLYNPVNEALTGLNSPETNAAISQPFSYLLYGGGLLNIIKFQGLQTEYRIISLLTATLVAFVPAQDTVQLNKETKEALDISRFLGKLTGISHVGAKVMLDIGKFLPIALLMYFGYEYSPVTRGLVNVYASFLQGVVALSVFSSTRTLTLTDLAMATVVRPELIAIASITRSIFSNFTSNRQAEITVNEKLIVQLKLLSGELNKINKPDVIKLKHTVDATISILTNVIQHRQTLAYTLFLRRPYDDLAPFAVRSMNRLFTDLSADDRYFFGEPIEDNSIQTVSVNINAVLELLRTPLRMNAVKEPIYKRTVMTRYLHDVMSKILDERTIPAPVFSCIIIHKMRNQDDPRYKLQRTLRASYIAFIRNNTNQTDIKAILNKAGQQLTIAQQIDQSTPVNVSDLILSELHRIERSEVIQIEGANNASIDKAYWTLIDAHVSITDEQNDNELYYTENSFANQIALIAETKKALVANFTKQTNNIISDAADTTLTAMKMEVNTIQSMMLGDNKYKTIVRKWFNEQNTDTNKNIVVYLVYVTNINDFKTFAKNGISLYNKPSEYEEFANIVTPFYMSDEYSVYCDTTLSGYLCNLFARIYISQATSIVGLTVNELKRDIMINLVKPIMNSINGKRLLGVYFDTGMHKPYNELMLTKKFSSLSV